MTLLTFCLQTLYGEDIVIPQAGMVRKAVTWRRGEGEAQGWGRGPSQEPRFNGTRQS